MKNWIWIVFIGIAYYIIVELLKLSIWIPLILLMPLFVIGMTIFSFCYSFRPSLKPEPIPPKGYENRLKDLEKEEAELNKLGFEKKDSFYLKTIPDNIVYMFKHTKDPVIACLYHIEAKKACDFISFFQDDITLTTCETVDGGLVPYPPRRLIQIFENLPKDKFLEKHRIAVDFIKQKGKKDIHIADHDLRIHLMKSIREYEHEVQKIPLWPVKLICWTIIRRGRVYLKSIEEQYSAGMIKIFS